MTPEDYGVSALDAREYAAIALRVPTSGTPWLDDMIRESLRNELAARAMQGAVAAGYANVENATAFVRRWADAMRKEMKA